MQIFNKNFWGLWFTLGVSLVGAGFVIFIYSFNLLKDSVLLILSVKLSVLGLSLEMSGLSDFYSSSFSGAVMMISGSVYIYSLSYMAMEKYFNRFMALVSLFILSMVVLIYSSNIIQLILGWDGLGLSSYLLVCYYNNSASSNAGGLTLMMNRLGDVGLFFMIYVLVNSSAVVMGGMSVSWGFGLLLLFVACTKSAQLPFSSWLPAAMAAPTPVSSLVHSSTLVTAGVYLLIRFYDSLVAVLSFSLLVAVSTSVMATFAAMFERDMKKIVALSTLSHLGIMISIMSFGWVELAFSHLIFHAFFKALLFLVVGYWIHSSFGYQDLVKINLLSFQEPVVSVFGGVALMSLCGLPYLTGFFSKDFFIEVCIQVNSSLLSLALMLCGSLGSFFYSVRLFLMVNKKGGVSCLVNWGNGPNFYVWSMVSLGVLSVVGGGMWSNYWVLSGSVLFIFWEVKALVSSLILLALAGGLSGSVVNLKGKFFIELGYLLKISRVFPNYLGKLVVSESVKLDNSFLSPYYSKYSSLSVSKYLLSEMKMSYYEMLLMGLLFSLVLFILGS